MSYTAAQLNFLQAHIGVIIAPAFLENKRRAQEFKQRLEKGTSDGAGKPPEWSFRSRFDGLLRGAGENAGKQKFDVALQLLGQAEEVLQQSEPPPQPPGPPAEAGAAEVTAEDMETLFEDDPEILLEREWARVKASMLPTLQAAAQKETPVKATLVQVLLDLVNLEKSGDLKEALAVIERARAPLKTALETEPSAPTEGESGAERMEFQVARNRAINDVTDAKASKGFGKAHADAVAAIQGLEKSVQDKEAAKQWTEGMESVKKLQEHARTVLRAQGPGGLVFADSNWGGGAHRTMFSMVVNPLTNEMQMRQMNEDGTEMRVMNQKTWVECPWDIKTDPKQFGGV